MSVVIRVIYEGTTYDLDIQEDIPLRLDISAIENTEIGEFFGVGSQTFDLPGTKNNNKFFKHAYNIGGEDIPAFYNTIDGFIISKGDTLLKGQFQLLETVKDEAGFVVYKCQITDETIQFKDNIQNKLIKNADWSSYTHTINTGSILDSWDGTLLGGKVFYPLADYGYNDPKSQGNYPLFAFGEPDQFGNVTGNFINNYLTPLQPVQFLPSLRAKDVLQTICAQAGFSASGDFLNSDAMEGLYILPKAKEEIGINVTGSEQATGYATNNYNQSIAPHPSGSGYTTTAPLAANQIITDPLGKFFNSGSEGYVYYLADGNGEYEVSTQIGFFNPVSFSTSVVEVELQLLRGSFPFSGTVIGSEKREFRSTDGFNTFTFTAGGTFTSTTSEEVFARIYYKHISGPTPPNLNLFGFSSNLRVLRAPEVINNATVDISLQWPADLKSIDIIRGLIQQFNLVVYPHPTQSKTIVFEQFDDWIRNGQTKDWTDKWNTATRVSIKHTIDEQPQELIIGNEDDSDRFSVEAKESDPFFQYGTLRVLADNNISQGSKSVKNIFGPVVLGGPFVSGSLTTEGVPTYNIELGSSFAYPHLYKFDNNNLKSYKFRTRLGYKVSNQFPSGSDKYRVILGTGFGDVTAISGSYSTLANTQTLPANNDGRDLHFNNTYFKFVGPGLNLSNTKSNFDSNWKTYVDSLYWDENRKVTLDIQFDSEEYKDIKLNDIIFVKDQQYRINKISGFNVTQDDIATVELIRLYPQYYQNNPNCDFDFAIEPLDCDFTFEAVPGLTPPPTATPTATPIPPTPTPADTVCTQYRAEWSGSLVSGSAPATFTMYDCYSGQALTWDMPTFASVGKSVYFTSRQFPLTSSDEVVILGPFDTVQPPNTFDIYTWDYGLRQTASLDVDNANYVVDTYYYYDNCEFTSSFRQQGVAQNLSILSGSVINPGYLGGAQIYYPVSSSTLCSYVPPATPTPTPTPSGQTPTPTPTSTPTPTPQVYSYTGFAGYANYLAACSGSATTIYTQGPIGTGSIAYEDAALTNVFDFNRFFIDANTGIGYEFVDPNTTGQVIGVQPGACNVETFRLFISFNQYDACSDTVVNTVYAPSGSTLANGTVLYEDINLEYSWWGQTLTEIKFIESGSSPRQIYYNTATGVSASGTDVCYEVLSFDGWDSTATTPPAATCGVTDETFYLAGPASVGDNIFTDAALTDYIFTGEKFVYNDDANELYAMSGSTGGDGSGWVIGSITSSYCIPPTPTPTPTPATIVTTFTGSYAYSSWDEACNNPAGTDTLYRAEIWNNIAPAGYETYIYEDAALTDIFDFYVYVVDTTTGIGYEMDDPNTTGKVYATQSAVCNPNQATIFYAQNEYTACSHTLSTTKYMDSGKNWGDSGVVLYDDFDRTQVFAPLANEFVSTSSLDTEIYEYQSGVLVGTGTFCSASAIFDGIRYTTLSPSPSPTCGYTERSFYVYSPIEVGTIIYTDAQKTSPLISSYNWVYNDNANELYRVVSGEVTEITGSICTPSATPTPTPDVQSYTMQRGYDASSQTCGTTYGQQTVYTNGAIAVGKTMYDSSALTDNVDFYEFWRDVNTNRVWRASTLTGEVLEDLGTSICPTPTPTSTPEPTPTSTDRWVILEGELCTQTSSTQRYNWYGDPNNFPAQFVYDANSGWCMDMFYISDGYNGAYPDMDCSVRYEYYNSCSDCQNALNEVPCS